MKKNCWHASACGVLILLALPAQAERADREKPINLEGERMSIDDIKKVQVLEGNAVLIQGTLEIRASRIVVTQDADGFQKGSATGGANGLARFKQKRDGRDEWMDGEAERIDYDAKSEKAEFFHRARVRSGLDEVKGPYISYEAINETYLVTNASASGSSSPTRVRAVIQPKGKSPNPAAAKGQTLSLKPASSISSGAD